MNSIVRTAALAACACLTACNAVYSTHPVGEALVKLDPEQWQGTWLHDEVVVTTTVMDADHGVLQAAWVERGEKGAKLEVAEGTIRSSGNWMFANLEERDEEGNARYLWLRVKRSDGRLIVWSPRVERFREFVEDQSLPGAVDTEDNVVLGKLEPAHLSLINAPSSNLLDWEDPDVFYRIGD